MLGLVPVVFPAGYHAPWLQGVCQHLIGKKDYFWDHSNGFNQWWIDAFTVDPQKLLNGMSGLWEHGRPQPVVKTDIENASPGKLPTVMVYIAVHPKFGTHAFFPYHGAKGGAADKDGPGMMFEGFKYWYSDLKPEVHAKIISQEYCNQPGGVQRFMKAASSNEQKAFAAQGKLNPRFFMVRAMRY